MPKLLVPEGGNWDYTGFSTIFLLKKKSMWADFFWGEGRLSLLKMVGRKSWICKYSL